MNWEGVTGIAAVVSAICAVVSLFYMAAPHKKESRVVYRLISIDKFMPFLLACSGWVLVCISYLWIMQPFGALPTDDEYKKFFGITLAFPAIIIFMVGLKYMQGEKDD